MISVCLEVSRLMAQRNLQSVHSGEENTYLNSVSVEGRLSP